MKNSKILSFTIKKILALLIISLVLSFLIYMGVLTVIRSSKNFAHLNYVEGQITGVRFIKHKYPGKSRTAFKDVLVLSVHGTSDEFGFTKDNEVYKILLDFSVIGKPVEIYYNGSGKRIEQGVTLHTFDLKIGNYQVLDIADIKRSERVGSILFFSAALVFLIIAVAVIRKKD